MAGQEVALDSVALAEFLHVFAVGAQDEPREFVLLAARMSFASGL